MLPRQASKIMAGGGGALLVAGFAAMAYLEVAITNAAEQGFKGNGDIWLARLDYGLIFVIVAGLFFLVYGFVSAQSESTKVRTTRSKITDASAAA